MVVINICCRRGISFSAKLVNFLSVNYKYVFSLHATKVFLLSISESSLGLRRSEC